MTAPPIPEWAREKVSELEGVSTCDHDKDVVVCFDCTALALVAAEARGRNDPETLAHEQRLVDKLNLKDAEAADALIAAASDCVVLIEQARAEGRREVVEEIAHDAAQGVFVGIFGQHLAITIRTYAAKEEK